MYFSPVNTLHNTLFSNTLSIRSSFNVSDQVTHPYTTGKIIVLDILLTVYHYVSQYRNQLNTHFKPLKMDQTEGSETSANIKQTLGKHPKVNTVKT
jgi:hypothetical protein